MTIPPQIIDNDKSRLVDFIVTILKDNPNTNLDIATAFFNITAFEMIKDYIGDVKRFRLLLGKTPEIRSDKTLGEALLDIIKEEIENFELSKEKENNVRSFIEFLKKDNVEVRIYDKQFLHGKAYIFDNAVVIGSSNFTPAGLTHNTELNTWQQEAQAEYVRKRWFEKFWKEARDFKKELIEILENSRFGSKEYTPYEIFIKTLYELQKEDIKEEEERERKGLPRTKVNLTDFQEDAIPRIKSRLKKYGAILIADSVGLGKTFISAKLLEEIGYYRRENILVICPAQLREMWRKFLKKIDVKENILSQEELASKDFLEKAKRAVGGDLSTVKLIVVDESHNFRNPLSNRWENFFTLVNEHIAIKERPYILFLTATPINNTIWDLYWQIMLLTLLDNRAFIKENIPDLFKFFREVEKRGDPSLLNDLLNEISIRRTRDYIKENYPDAYIIVETPDGEIKKQKIVFPERILENVNYKLDETYRGMYRWISDIITNKLTMAYYRILEYKKTEKLTPEEELTLGRMIAIGGIFRTILLKRLESSVEAFRVSVSKHIKFLKKLKKYLKQGKLLTKESFNKYIMSMDEEIEEEEIKETLEGFNPKDYRMDELIDDIDKDIKLLNIVLDRVKQIEPKDDAKLKKLKEILLSLSKKGQIVLFTYYADTLNYIYNEIKKSKEFSNYRIEAISSSGVTKKSPKEREKIVEKFINKEIDILMSTDVLSEGQNLQSAQYLINYDLHWNPTRMIQRAGRIDRIGSPYKEIYVYNFFPEDELEELLRLVQILQTKIIEIDASIGLDQKVLGEEIHPKVFGVIRRIKEKDSTIFQELERDAFGGGEKFYQPLKDFLKKRGIDELEKIPYGVYSGLKKNKISGIFFYYKYGNDFHFWYLYDVSTGNIITNKTQIIEYISCPPEEKRVIPDFFDKVYEINKIILENIERTYKEIELSQTQDSILKDLSVNRGTKFMKKMFTEIELQIEDYLAEFPDDDSIEKVWETIKGRLLSIQYTKARIKELRRYWREYKKDGDWKKLIKRLGDFAIEKSIAKRRPIEPFDKSKLKLITIDFIS